MKTLLLKNKFLLSLMLIVSLNSPVINAQGSSDGPSSASDTQSFTLQFNSINGPLASRALELSFSETTSDDFDDGLDIKNLQLMPDDLNLFVNGEFYTAQAYAAITEDKTVNLAFQASGDYDYSITLTSMENMGSQGVEIRDNLLGTAYELTTSGTYTFSSVSGYFPNRFQIAFKAQTLSQDDFDMDNMDIRYVNNTRSIAISNPSNLDLERVEVFNMAGQSVYNNAILTNESLINYQVNNLKTGIYIIRLFTKNDTSLTEKVLIR